MKKTLMLFAILFSALTANAQRITVTIAGNAIDSVGGDNGPGKRAGLNMPKDVCLDAHDNIYIVDTGNGRIRKLSSAKGVITTVAGGGTSLSDGIAATNAKIFPSYICIDTLGNLFFTSSNMVKEVIATTGTIRTIAGSVAAGYGGDGGPATAAILNHPEGICVDAAGNLFFADRLNNRIRKIAYRSGIISTIAGTGVAGFTGDGGPATGAELYSPVTITVTRTGSIIFSDQQPNYPSGFDASVIREIGNWYPTISTIVDDSSWTYNYYDEPATSVVLGSITGMCIEKSTGNLYFNEWSCSSRYLDFTTDTVNLVGGNFGIESFSDDTASPFANMSHPAGICIDAKGTVYIADRANNRVRKIIQLSNTPKFAYGPGESLEATIGIPYNINYPLAITDVDSGQNETWTVINTPAYGILSGFPAEMTSKGTGGLNIPTGLSYTPTATTYETDSFSVQISDGTLKDTITVFITDSLRRPEATSPGQFKERTFNIFPNPVSSNLTVQWQNQEPGSSIILITDILGKIVCRTTLVHNSANGSSQIDLSGLEPGIYLLSINSRDVRKLVKF